jgi:hypothetical protein
VCSKNVAAGAGSGFKHPHHPPSTGLGSTGLSSHLSSGCGVSYVTITYVYFLMDQHLNMLSRRAQLHIRTTKGTRKRRKERCGRFQS